MATQWTYVKGEFNRDNHGSASGSILTDDDDGWFVATIEDAPDTDANARLIAAAPDMLAALIDAQSAMKSHNLSRKHEGHECPWDFAEGFGGCFDKVTAAIAKALSSE